SYRMKVSGSGAPGFLNGEGTLTLSENAEGTLLTYAGDVQVGGRIASVGQRLIESTAKSIIRQGLKALDDQLLNGDKAEPAQPVQSAPPVASPETAPVSGSTAAPASAPPPAMG